MIRVRAKVNKNPYHWYEIGTRWDNPLKKVVGVCGFLVTNFEDAIVYTNHMYLPKTWDPRVFKSFLQENLSHIAKWYAKNHMWLLLPKCRFIKILPSLRRVVVSSHPSSPPPYLLLQDHLLHELESSLVFSGCGGRTCGMLKVLFLKRNERKKGYKPRKNTTRYGKATTLFHVQE